MKKTTLLIIGVVFLASGLFAGGSKDSDETILRIGSASNGPNFIIVADAVMAEFEETHPGVKVTWDRSAGDDYEFAGLPSMLQSDNPPDIYFEWGGARVKNHYLDGEAMDISDLAKQLAPSMNQSAWSGSVFDGKTFMIPMSHDITIQIWYNEDIFDELGLSVPSDWDEFMALNEAIVAAGKTPLVMGNADAWVTGNFIGLFLYRMAGDDKANSILNLEKGTSLDDPDFVKALQYAYDMAQKGFFNADMNTLGYEESFSRMFDGSSVMYPLGSWYTDEVVGLMGLDYKDVNHDYFMLPPFPDGKGSSSSVLGLNTGYMINSKTENKELAYEFLTLLLSVKYQKQMADIGNLSTVSAATSKDDAYLQRYAATLNDASAIVAPPDTGYDLEMAFALYEAIAKVSEGLETPQEALAVAEASVKHLR